MLTLNSSPTSNGLAVRVSLLHNGAIQATLNPGEAKALTVSFDSVMLVNPGLPPVVRAQQPPANNFASNPGDIAIIESGPGGVVDVSYAPHGGHAQRVQF